MKKVHLIKNCSGEVQELMADGKVLILRDDGDLELFAEKVFFNGIEGAVRVPSQCQYIIGKTEPFINEAMDIESALLDGFNYAFPFVAFALFLIIVQRVTRPTTPL